MKVLPYKISVACSGKVPSAYGFIWRYCDDESVPYEEVPIKQLLEICQANWDHRTNSGKSVVQVNPETGEAIMQFSSQGLASRFMNIAQSQISLCCKGQVSRAAGYVF